MHHQFQPPSAAEISPSRLKLAEFQLPEFQRKALQMAKAREAAAAAEKQRIEDEAAARLQAIEDARLAAEAEAAAATERERTALLAKLEMERRAKAEAAAAAKAEAEAKLAAEEKAAEESKWRLLRTNPCGFMAARIHEVVPFPCIEFPPPPPPPRSPKREAGGAAAAGLKGEVLWGPPASPAPAVAPPEPAPFKCYLLFSETNGGSFVMQWSDAGPPDEALACYRPRTAPAEWRLQRHDGRSELCRGVGGPDHRSFYQGWCSFVKLAWAAHGTFEFLGQLAKLPVSLFLVDEIASDCF